MNLTLELSGLNLERLLRTAGENGVRLQMSAAQTNAPCASPFRPRRKESWPRSAGGMAGR